MCVSFLQRCQAVFSVNVWQPACETSVAACWASVDWFCIRSLEKGTMPPLMTVKKRFALYQWSAAGISGGLFTPLSLCLCINSLQYSKLAHALFEVVLELNELPHVVLVPHRVQHGCVNKRRADHVDPDSIVSERRGVLDRSMYTQEQKHVKQTVIPCLILLFMVVDYSNNRRFGSCEDN